MDIDIAPIGTADQRRAEPPSAAPPSRSGIRRPSRLLWRWARGHVVGIVSIVAGLLLWQFVARVFFSPVLFPTPTDVWPTAVAAMKDGSLWEATKVSLARIMTGFAIGSAGGAIAGLLMARIRIVARIFDPWLQLLRFIPVIALIAPMIVWFGIGEESKVALIVYTTVFIVTLNTMAGVRAISDQKIRAAQCLGASSAQVMFSVIVPGSLAHILTGMRLAMGNAFATVVAAELIAADSGIGYLINQARLFLDSRTIFLGIIMLGVLGFLADTILVSIQRIFLSRYTSTK